MTQRTGQDLLIIGSFLLLALIVSSPLLDRVLSPTVPTVDASATVKVLGRQEYGAVLLSGQQVLREGKTRRLHDSTRSAGERVSAGCSGVLPIG
jgi:hypothetical protein